MSEELKPLNTKSTAKADRRDRIAGSKISRMRGLGCWFVSFIVEKQRKLIHVEK